MKRIYINKYSSKRDKDQLKNSKFIPEYLDESNLKFEYQS